MTVQFQESIKDHQIRLLTEINDKLAEAFGTGTTDDVIGVAEQIRKNAETIAFLQNNM